MRAATSRCSAESGDIAPSRCSSTMCCAPPSVSSVARRRTSEPAARSSSQIRCITSWRYGASIVPPGRLRSLDGAHPSERRLDPSGAHLVEHRLDELGLERDGLAGQLVVALAPGRRSPLVRTRDRGGRAGACSRRARDPAREPIQLRERILAQRDEDVHSKRARNESGSARANGSSVSPGW